MPTTQRATKPLQTTLSMILSIAAGALMILMINASCAQSSKRIPKNDQYTPERYTYASLLMGSRCTIALYAPTEPQAAQAATHAFNEIERIEQILTDYNPDSESMRVMQRKPNQWHPVSQTLHNALLRSKHFSTLSNGAFDPTIGASTHLWRRTTSSGRIPTPKERAIALARSGIDKLRIDPDSPRIMFTTTGIILDFGGIGKGYAADQALQALKAQGISSAMVNLGGDIALSDPPPNQPQGWRIQIQTGLSESTTKYISNAAIATSGDLEQHFTHQGQRYSHILDPKTALGITHPIAVTVIAPSATTADALASIVSVLGRDRSTQLKRPPNTTVIIVTPKQPNQATP